MKLKDALKLIPLGFVSDGLSGGFPDWAYSHWNLGVIDYPHAWSYCTRCHSAGSMTKRAQEKADKDLKRHARGRLPWWLPLAPLILFAGVTIGGHSSFDTCYVIEPQGATKEQWAEGLCRHGMKRPGWMK